MGGVHLAPQPVLHRGRFCRQPVAVHRRVRFTYFADVQALNLAAIAGNFDMQARHIQMTNYPVLKEQERSGKYRILTWPTFGGSDAQESRKSVD